MIKIKLMFSFIKWMFMKVFGGCFESAESFRYELKKGGTETGLACIGFLLLSLVGLIIVALTTMGFATENDTVKLVANSYSWLVLFTFLYNVFKSAFECFIAERAKLFEILKESK